MSSYFCRFFISQAIIISSVTSHHLKCQHHFSSPFFHIFMSHTTHKYGLLQPMSRCVYFFRFNSTRLMSRLQVVFRGRFVCDKNIHYTITCSFVYPATVLGQFQRGCLLKSDMSAGDARFNDIIMRYEYLGARRLRRARRKQSTVTRQSRLTVTTQNKGANEAA